MRDHAKLSKALFDALAHGDGEAVRRSCDRDFRVSQNGGAEMDLERLLGFTAAVLRVVRNFRYEGVTCSVTESGFVEEHSVRGTLPDGSQMDFKVCVVADVVDGKITDVREYFDSRAAGGLVKALGSA